MTLAFLAAVPDRRLDELAERLGEAPAWLVDRVALVASYLGEGPRGRSRHETLGEFLLSP